MGGFWTCVCEWVCWHFVASLFLLTGSMSEEELVLCRAAQLIGEFNTGMEPNTTWKETSLVSGLFGSLMRMVFLRFLMALK